MRRTVSTLLVWLALAIPAWGKATVKGEKTYAPHEPIVLKAADVTSKAAQFLWEVDGKAQVREAGDTLYVWAPPGNYKVRLIAVDFEAKKVERATLTFTVTGKVPDPGPDPKPPEPDPDNPAPIPAEGLRVLIVYESGELSKLPSRQQAVLFSKTFRDYLRGKCLTDKDNPTGAWRIWDKDVDASGETKLWQDALKRDRKSVPWLIVSNGKAGFEGPLPESVDKTIELVRKYEPRAKKGGGQ